MKQQCIVVKMLIVLDLKKVALINVWYAIIVCCIKRKQVQNERIYRKVDW